MECCESKKNFFGKEKKVPTFMSSKEVETLLKTESETN